MFSMICVWINGWVNNRESGDLRHHHAHYDVTIMCSEYKEYHSVSGPLQLAVMAPGLSLDGIYTSYQCCTQGAIKSTSYGKHARTYSCLLYMYGLVLWGWMWGWCIRIPNMARVSYTLPLFIDYYNSTWFLQISGSIATNHVHNINSLTVDLYQPWIIYHANYGLILNTCLIHMVLYITVYERYNNANICKEWHVFRKTNLEWNFPTIT